MKIIDLYMNILKINLKVMELQLRLDNLNQKFKEIS